MTESTRLAGLTCLVTGASRGIGRASAIALAEQGASVWAMARSADALQELQRECGAVPIMADLMDDHAVWTALDEVAESSGGVPDVAVNAAGVFGVEACESESVASFDAHLAVNLRAPFLVTRYLLPDMLKRGSGLIVHIGSVAGRKAFPGNAAYSASKFAVKGFTEALIEYGLSRPFGFTDEDLANEIMSAAKDNGFAVSDIVQALVQTKEFRSK